MKLKSDKCGLVITHMAKTLDIYVAMVVAVVVALIGSILGERNCTALHRDIDYLHL